MKVIGAEAELYVIGIDPAHSGKSLGSALLDHTLREILDGAGSSAPSPEIEHVTLYVDEANVSAVALYAALGFSTWRTSRQWMLNRR
jgi:mycothiol synthase